MAASWSGSGWPHAFTNCEADEDEERRALKAVAVTFSVLAAYVTVERVRVLAGGEEPHSSTGEPGPAGRLRRRHAARPRG